jgi:hypothetical protein
MNRTWHEKHKMPSPATLQQRIAWHRAHQRHCACRGVPASLRSYIEAKKPPRRS